MTETMSGPPLERRYFGFAGLPGGGPWLISAYCSARNHNTQTAARRIHQSGGACTCPRAVSLLQVWIDEHPGREWALRERVGPKMRTAGPEPITATVPSFAAGLCTTSAGASVMAGGMNEGSNPIGIRDRAKAVQLCNAGGEGGSSCPIRDSVCRPWVLGQESPAGSWGGVWGGLDPWQRMGKELVWDKDLKEAKLIDYVIH